MTTEQKKGFTIIEVVLVLAIAGLIFLMVFIALPAMQKGQRDDARKRDASLIASAVTVYSGANRGSLPDTTALQNSIEKLSGNIEKDKVTVKGHTPSVTLEDGSALVVTGAKCGTSTNTSQAIERGSSRQFVVVTKLEQGNGQYFCQEN